MADNDKSTEKIEEKGGISVQTEHIFPIIKKWLYSEKKYFSVRLYQTHLMLSRSSDV